MTSRDELDGLGREALISMAASLGVANARAMPRADLVDEILLRRGGSARASRGLFGLARDLLARVVEKGLHLPDAAERVGLSVVPEAPPGAASSLVVPALNPSVSSGDASARAEIATVTLASIYASQGLRDRALETVTRVLEKEPRDRAALSLKAHLLGAPLKVPATLQIERRGARAHIEWNAGDLGTELAVLSIVHIRPQGIHPDVQRSDRVVASRGAVELDVSERDVVHAAIGVERRGVFHSRAHA